MIILVGLGLGVTVFASADLFTPKIREIRFSSFASSETRTERSCFAGEDNFINIYASGKWKSSDMEILP